MHEIRKNQEEEIELLTAKFTVPKVLLICAVIFTVIFTVLFIVGISLMAKTIDDYFYDYYSYYSDQAAGYSLLSIGLFGIVFGAIFILMCFDAKKSRCSLSNKRIYGERHFLFTKRKYSFRLDEIDTVETSSTFGFNTLTLNFTQGKNVTNTVTYSAWGARVQSSNTFKIYCVKNVQEVYEKTSELLTAVKNEKDVMVDIEMSKVEAENRKAAAFEKMAMGASQQKDNVQKLKDLKELLDSGVITQEEFESEKKKLLQ